MAAQIRWNSSCVAKKKRNDWNPNYGQMYKSINGSSSIGINVVILFVFFTDIKKKLSHNFAVSSSTWALDPFCQVTRRMSLIVLP